MHPQIELRWLITKTSKTVMRNMYPGRIPGQCYPCKETVETKVLQYRIDQQDWIEIPTVVIERND